MVCTTICHFDRYTTIFTYIFVTLIIIYLCPIRIIIGDNIDYNILIPLISKHHIYDNRFAICSTTLYFYIKIRVIGYNLKRCILCIDILNTKGEHRHQLLRDSRDGRVVHAFPGCERGRVQRLADGREPCPPE